MTTCQPNRHLHIDALKFIASHLIVLHHLLAYGPISDVLRQAAPELIGWLFQQSRMAVQIFLVMGGYLAARSLSPMGQAWRGSFVQVISRHYQKRVLPFLVAMLLAVAGATLARIWLDDAFIPAAPSWPQFLAHALLLQGLLGQDALSAGIWYVAIDFQLFALMALVLWLTHKLTRKLTYKFNTSTQRQHVDSADVARLAQGLVLALMLGSLFIFNRDAAWDNWALYFFGAYGMGAAAYWVGSARRPGWYLGFLALCGLLALWMDFRERIGLALVVALLLGLVQWRGHASMLSSLPLRCQRWLTTMSQLSYALFLVHFVVLMLGNAVFFHLELDSPLAAVVSLMTIWLLSLAAAHGFERWIERPLARRGGFFQPRSSAGNVATYVVGNVADNVVDSLLVHPVKLA